MRPRFLLSLIAAVLLCGATGTQAKDISLLNVSYDPTREFYKQYDELFAKYWKAKTGDDVTISTSHGGSGLRVCRSRTIVRAIASACSSEVA